MTPKVKSAPDPSVSTGAVILKFSKRTFNREKALKSFLKSDKNSRLYSTFNLLRNKKTPCIANDAFQIVPTTYLCIDILRV